MTAQVAALGAFLRAERASGRGYLPAGEQVLRAFAQPIDAVRVLIVGQDPYPSPGHAVGLAFSVAASVHPLPRSLQNIYQELEADLGLPRPRNGDLSPWADRGVMLLNRVLTVRPGAAGSHRGKGWETVTAQAISALPSAEDLWWPSCGAETLRPRSPPWAASRASRARTRRRCPHTGDSSVRDRSAAPTPCSAGRAATPLTGVCPDRPRLGRLPAVS